MKTIKIKIEEKEEFEIKVENNDLPTLLKILWAWHSVNRCANRI